MNVSHTNFGVSVDLTNQTMGTNLQVPQAVLQPPPLVMRRKTTSAMEVVDDEIICIESDGEDTQNATHPVTNTIGTHLPNLSQGKIVTIKKNNKIFKIMIPRNVIPNMSNSPCPVTLNIPGIGPLKIKIDPFVKYNIENPMPPSLRPFSLNFDDIHRRASFINTGTGSGEKTYQIPRKRSATTVDKNYSVKKNVPVKTDKFCYTLNMGIINTLGFGFTECRQPKKCLNALNALIRKMKVVLSTKMKELKRLTNASRKNTNVKAVPISKIVGTQEVIHLSDSSDNESVCNRSLLVTKKVVILNDGNKYEKNTRKRRRGRPKQINKKPEKNTIPCYVKLTRDPHIEKVYRDVISKMGNDIIKSFSVKKQNQPSKSKAPPSINIQKFIIDTEAKFRNHIAYIKPITVINQNNYQTIKSYKEEFCRMNIVFALKGSLPQFMQQDTHFVSAVSDGYVKLVDDELLCSYFLRELGPN